MNGAHTGAVHQWRDRSTSSHPQGRSHRSDLSSCDTEAPSWCPACETVGWPGVQSFKKPGSAGDAGRGRARRSTSTAARSAAGVVDPPAATCVPWVIDWSLPAGRIRDRVKPLAVNTLERIRRGPAKYGPHLVAGEGNTWDELNSGVGLPALLAAGRTRHPCRRAGSSTRSRTRPIVVEEDGLDVRPHSTPRRARRRWPRCRHWQPQDNTTASSWTHRGDGQAFPDYVPSPTATVVLALATPI